MAPVIVNTFLKCQRNYAMLNVSIIFPFFYFARFYLIQGILQSFPKWCKNTQIIFDKKLKCFQSMAGAGWILCHKLSAVIVCIAILMACRNIYYIYLKWLFQIIILNKQHNVPLKRLSIFPRNVFYIQETISNGLIFFWWPLTWDSRTRSA